MKKIFVPIEAVKIHMDDSSRLLTGGGVHSNCFAWVGNEMQNLTCKTSDPGKVINWDSPMTIGGPTDAAGC